MIITELSPHGDFLHHLRKLREIHFERESVAHNANMVANHFGVTPGTMCNWCEQIASGMEYLTQKQIVHGDLAARNVLVFKDDVVKISDFGLSKQLYGSSTYQRKKKCKLPWKWAAIELLKSMQYSESSDVWAFGVTAWVIFSLGQVPYKGMTFSREFLQFLQDGSRLTKPEHASEEIYNILLQCWESERGKRPNFPKLKQFFHGLLSQETAKLSASAIYGEDSLGSTYVSAI